MFDAGWQPAGPERFRLFDGGAPAPAVAESGLTSLSTPSAAARREVGLLGPDNPLVAFGVLAALTFGLMAFSTSGTVRVGKTKIAAGVGVGST